MCRNCGIELNGRYCSNCGQKATVKELTIHDLIHELWHSITHTDKGVIRLVKDLILHPKSVYLNYFNGQRKKYFSPVTFFLLAAAILIFVGIKIFDYEDYVVRTYNEFGRYVLTETKFLSLILLPLEVFITWAFFRRQYNLAKHVVFWLFFNGLQFTIKTLASPVYFLFIRHKLFLDNCIGYSLIVLMLWHLILVFGSKKWINYLFCLIAANVVLISSYVLQAYLLFGTDLLLRTHSKNIFQLMLGPYQW